MAVITSGRLRAGAFFSIFCAALFLPFQTARALQDTTSLLSVVDYSPDHVTFTNDSVTLKMTQQSGSRVHSVGRYSYGVLTASIKCPSGDTTGLVPSFYTSSGEGTPDNDEVDFEFLGKNRSTIQTNYFINAMGHHEAVHDLGFDCAQAFHDYTVEWTPAGVKWLIDGRLIRTCDNFNGSACPTKPAYLYASIWDSGSPGWNGVATYADAPYFFQLANVSVRSLSETAPGPASSPARSPEENPVGSPRGSPTGSQIPGRKLMRF